MKTADTARVTYGDPVWELIHELTAIQDKYAALSKRLGRNRTTLKNLRAEAAGLKAALAELSDRAAAALGRPVPLETTADGEAGATKTPPGGQ